VEAIREGRTGVAPTVGGRIQSLDVLRGFAVLGILFANLTAFSGPTFGESMGGGVKPLHGWDAWVDVLTAAFVTGKFRGALAILFGAGLYLQFAKRSAIPGNWPGGYLKRTAWLAVFGLVHGLAIWYGDILFSYAVTALICCLFVRLQDRILNWVAAGTMALATLVGLGLGALTWLGSMFSQDQPDSGGVFSVAAEIHAYGVGSYGEQFVQRLMVFGLMAVFMIFLLPNFCGLFFVGMRLAKTGFLAAPSKHPRLRNWLLWLGLGVGLPFNLASLLYFRTGVSPAYDAMVESAFSPFLAVAYVTLVAMAVEAGLFKPIGLLFSNVGRVALTCYIMQSLICTTLFYSWGFGLFNRLDRVQNVGVACAVALINMVFAALWLRRFAIGPLEWLWRSLTEGKRMPILKRGYSLTPVERPETPRFDVG
jgi:uncharacterized protein